MNDGADYEGHTRSVLGLVRGMAQHLAADTLRHLVKWLFSRQGLTFPVRPIIGGESMDLSAPKTFIISVIVAVVAVIIHYANIAMPGVHSGFVVLLVAYLILVAGNVLSGV
jgi:hypothetical protein